MTNRNELQELIDSELNHNLCELEKMIAIYERIGMEKQAAEIKRMIRSSAPVHRSTLFNSRAA